MIVYPEISTLNPVLPLISLLISCKLLKFVLHFVKWETGQMRVCKTRWKLTWMCVLFIMSFMQCTAFCNFTPVPPLPGMLTNSSYGYSCHLQMRSSHNWIGSYREENPVSNAVFFAGNREELCCFHFRQLMSILAASYYYKIILRIKICGKWGTGWRRSCA